MDKRIAPTKNPHAVALGRKGGRATSPAKTAAARQNGTKGGRPARTPAQDRLLEEIRRQGGADGGAEYWPVVNDWVRDAGPAQALAFRNITRTVAALLRSGMVTLDDDGYFHLT
jgi:hypothetical protein